MILRHLSRHHSFTPAGYGYGRIAFRRRFQASRPRWAELDEWPPRMSIGQRIKEKFKDFGKGLVAFAVIGTIYSILPTWDDALDAVCRVVGPKAVAHNALSGFPRTVYSSIHQDPAIRQLITRSDEFRVLVVEPGTDDEPVRCRLVNVAESWRTRYDALSYTWGDENLRSVIIVDGLRTSVTKNLHSALTHLRDSHRERTLWVDALCINQDDPEERDEQVTKMGSIYSRARKVVVWLGEQTKEVEGAFATLEKGAHNMRYSWSSPRNLPPESQSLDWLPVFNLLRRPWFQRTWIIQEAVLGREPVLACGFETIPWKTLTSCCDTKYFQDLALDNGPELTQALEAIDLITHGRYERHTTHVTLPKRRGQKYVSTKKYTPDFKLVSTLYETRGFQCKDARDRVFGVLSLVTNVGREDGILGPNYRASVEEVFQSVARWEIEKNHNLELLSYCSRKELNHPDLPSWAPDFSDIEDSYAISFLQKRDARKTRRRGFTNEKQKPNPGLEGDYEPCFTQENGKTVLVLSGMMVDKITSVGAAGDSCRMPHGVGYGGPRNLVHKRRFCATLTGREGWVPGCTREGDLVCLISGAEVPIVLRRVSEDEGQLRYSVVGDAFFDGLMYCKWRDTPYYVGGGRLSIV
ncbi:hypothetical protein ACHAPT_009288 [Fusarium lateritium]